MQLHSLNHQYQITPCLTHTFVKAYINKYNVRVGLCLFFCELVTFFLLMHIICIIYLIHNMIMITVVRWPGVTEARGDYPFSHHKLTVQFYEVAAAQDRKLEGLVHNAILELWRPEPSELTLLLTKGVESTLLKVPPPATTLTGSSDPCYIEAYHLADSSDGRISLHLKVKLASCLLKLLLKALYFWADGFLLSGDSSYSFVDECAGLKLN